MQCEKCRDKGFTEQEHGLIMVFCDCEKGEALREEIMGEGAPPEVKLPNWKELQEDRETLDDSNSGAGQPDKSIGSKDTSKPKRTRKSKKKKGARKRAG